MTKPAPHSKLSPAQHGEVAQRRSSGLISHWLWVQIPPSPQNDNQYIRWLFSFINPVYGGFLFLDSNVKETIFDKPLVYFG